MEDSLLNHTDPTTITFGVDPTEYQVPYNPPSSVESFHELPRFSHSDDFSLLFTENSDQYTLGLVFLAIFIISFFVVWGFSLLVLKCIGPKRVGVFAGFPYKEDGWESVTGRVVLLFSSLSVIILAIILTTKGLTELQMTTDTIDYTNQDAMKITDDLQSIVDNLQGIARQASSPRDQLAAFLLRNVCPLEPNSINEADVRQIGNETLGSLYELNDFIENELLELEVTMKQYRRATNDIESAVSKTQFSGPQVTAIMIPYFIIPAFLVVAVIMGWYDVFYERYYIFMSWFIMPIMILMTMFAFIASGFVVMAVQGNSDFCYPTPEYNIQNILDQGEFEPGTMYYDLNIFYTNQCNPEFGNPWDFLGTYQQQLIAAIEKIKKFLDIVIQTTPEQLSQECGVEYEPVQELLNTLSVFFTVLLQNSDRGLYLMSCPNIVPLYTNAIYDGMCQYSITGAKWMFACLLLISFFGMQCIMFRGAYYPIDYFYYITGSESKGLYGTSESEEVEDDEEDDDDEEDETREDDYDDDVNDGTLEDVDLNDPDGAVLADEITDYNVDESIVESAVYDAAASDRYIDENPPKRGRKNKRGKSLLR